MRKKVVTSLVAFCVVIFIAWILYLDFLASSKFQKVDFENATETAQEIETGDPTSLKGSVLVDITPEQLPEGWVHSADTHYSYDINTGTVYLETGKGTVPVIWEGKYCKVENGNIVTIPQ